MQDDVERARQAALRHLDRRRRTRQELDDRLRQAGHAGESRRQALDRLERVGLVDDLEYARIFLRERLARRAVGEKLLRRSLAQRGVLHGVIEEAMAEVLASGSGESDLTERSRATRAARELARKYAALDPPTRRRRLLAALARRGFSYSLVSEIVELSSRE